MGRSYAAAACLVAMTLAACGSTESPPADVGAAAKTAPEPTAPPQASVTIVSPADGDTVAPGAVEVRGTVTPPDATVKVVGTPAEVADGAFSATVKLPAGADTIDVVATVAGAEPGTAAVSVVRGKTAEQLAAEQAESRARRAREAADRRKAAERARKRAAARTTVPDLVGERLDIAEDDLRSRGLRFTEIGGGTFGILVLSNWTVCETRPAAGTSVAKRARVKLIVDRDC